MAAKTFPPANTTYPIEAAYVSSMEQYKEIYDRSIKDPEAFWANVAERITWFRNTVSLNKPIVCRPFTHFEVQFGHFVILDLF